MPSVVSCILTNANKILILKRSNKVSTYKGFWGVVAGYVEPSMSPRDTAYKEIQEEVGLESNEILMQEQIDPIAITDTYDGKEYDWLIHPFLFQVKHAEKIRIDWEHSEYRWIDPSDIDSYKTTPGLREIVKKNIGKIRDEMGKC